MFLRKELKDTLIMCCQASLRIKKEEKHGKQNLRYYICQTEFRKDRRLYCVRLQRDIEFLIDQDEILDETVGQRPRPIRSQSPDGPSSAATCPATAVAGSALEAANSALAAVGTSGEEAEDAGETGDTYAGDEGLEEGESNLSRQASRTSPGPSNLPAEQEHSPVAEENYENIVASVADFRNSYNDDAIDALISGEDDKDMKMEYDEAAAAAVAGGGEKWPEMKRIWKAFERDGVVYAMVELSVTIFGQIDPTLRMATTNPTH